MTSYRICDLGGSIHFWVDSNLSECASNVEIFNLSNDAACSEITSHESESLKGVRVFVYDGQHVPRADKYYDLLVCNSVIEHVAQSQRRILIREMLRIAKRIYLQTPAREFAIDPHFLIPLIHWLPKSVGYYLALISPWRLLSRPDRDTIQQYFFETNLLSRQELSAIFPEAKLLSERAIGMTKAHLAVIS
jgi:hypothetical protein